MELKPCPFCGGEAKLLRELGGHRCGPTTITDGWTVQCKNKCCKIGTFNDEIYHRDDGEIEVSSDGAKKAAEVWNRRA